MITRVLDDPNKEIGIALLAIGCGLFLLGVLFLFDRALLLLGNIAFLTGLYFLVGMKTMFAFFTKEGFLSNCNNRQA